MLTLNIGVGLISVYIKHIMMLGSKAPLEIKLYQTWCRLNYFFVTTAFESDQAE